MPFLVHWNNSGAVVTLCAATVAKADLLPDHLALAGVKGLSDADYPSLEIENLYVRRSDVVYIAEGRTIAAVQKKEQEGEENGSIAGTARSLRGVSTVDGVGDRENNERLAQPNGEETERDRKESSETNGVQKQDRRGRYRRASNEGGKRTTR